MTTPDAAALHDNARYELLLELPHADLARALRPWLFRASPVTLCYWAVNLLAVGLIGWLWTRTAAGEVGRFPLLCLGFCGAWFALLPVHECIHAAQYRAVGASRVCVRYRWRNATACCLADRFVIGGRAFGRICLGPSLILNPLLSAGALAPLSDGWRLALAGALLLHVGAGSGDVALVNALWHWRRRTVWTYDDEAGAVTRFFATRAIARP